MKPCAEKARLDLVDQARLAAEEMRDAGDVEHHAVAPVERDQRRIARAGVGEALQPCLLRRRIGLGDDQRGMARARVGERQPRGQAEPRGAHVDADEPARVLDRRHDRKRRVDVDLMRAPRAVRRQTRQPEGEKSPVRQTFCPRFAR